MNTFHAAMTTLLAVCAIMRFRAGFILYDIDLWYETGAAPPRGGFHGALRAPVRRLATQRKKHATPLK